MTKEIMKNLFGKIFGGRKEQKILVVDAPAPPPVEVINIGGAPKRKYDKTVLTWPSGQRGQFVKPEVEQGRNRPCPCGSGKKYKKCCLEKNNKPTREMVIAASIKTQEGNK